MNHEFENIEVKQNSLKLLKIKIACNDWERGNNSLYIPLEKIGICEKIIEINLKVWFCIYMQKIIEKLKTVFLMTLTNADNDLCKIIEPNVCPHQGE